MEIKSRTKMPRLGKSPMAMVRWSSASRAHLLIAPSWKPYEDATMMSSASYKRDASVK